MTRTPKKPADKDSIGEAIETLIYTPSLAQRRAKVRLWSKAGDNPSLQISEDIPVTQLEAICGTSSISRWKRDPAFLPWLLNREDFREKLEVVAGMAVDSLEEILTDQHASASAKVAAARLALEVAAKMPKYKDSSAYLDEEVAGMDLDRLNAFIDSRTKLLESKK